MIIGSRYIFCRDIESTNTYASQIIQQDAVFEGTIIYTNYQSAGRGQKGNRWESEDGKNLLFSVILFPTIVSAEEQFIISMFISLGILDFFKMQDTYCKIKWPNDIYAGDDKIAGILIENSIVGTTINSSVAGIGVNIIQEKFPDHVPNPVSLKILTGKDYNLDVCLKQLAGCLDNRYKQVISGYRSEIRDEYTSSLYRLNAWHKFISENGEFTGRLLSVTDSGQLVIEEVGGKKREFSFREVEFSV